MRVRKSGCVESNWTRCCTGEFNTALSLCGVLGVAFYFSESFLEVAAGVSAVAEAPQPLGETMVCFSEQESSLWSPVPQYKHRLFSRRFLRLSLVNLPLLASFVKIVNNELDFYFHFYFILFSFSFLLFFYF